MQLEKLQFKTHRFDTPAFLRYSCSDNTCRCHLNHRRREFIKPDLNRSYRQICTEQTELNSNRNRELYLHNYNNAALQKRGKHDNYSNLNIRVQLQH